MHKPRDGTSTSTVPLKKPNTHRLRKSKSAHEVLVVTSKSSRPHGYICSSNSERVVLPSSISVSSSSFHACTPATSRLRSLCVFNSPRVKRTHARHSCACTECRRDERRQRSRRAETSQTHAASKQSHVMHRECASTFPVAGSRTERRRKTERHCSSRFRAQYDDAVVAGVHAVAVQRRSRRRRFRIRKRSHRLGQHRHHRGRRWTR